MNETLQTIQNRRSCRAYLQKPLPKELLDTIVGAGLCAPRAADEARHFTAVSNQQLLQRLNLAAKQSACGMALHHLAALGQSESFHCLYHAPALVIISGDDLSPVPLQSDCAAALQNMLLAAQSLGLGSCWIYFVLMAFRSPQAGELREALKIPEGYTPMAAAVFGYKKEDAPPHSPAKPGLITYIE